MVTVVTEQNKLIRVIPSIILFFCAVPYVMELILGMDMTYSALPIFTIIHASFHKFRYFPRLILLSLVYDDFRVILELFLSFLFLTLVFFVAFWSAYSRDRILIDRLYLADAAELGHVVLWSDDMIHRALLARAYAGIDRQVFIYSWTFFSVSSDRFPFSFTTHSIFRKYSRGAISSLTSIQSNCLFLRAFSLLPIS